MRLIFPSCSSAYWMFSSSTRARSSHRYDLVGVAVAPIDVQEDHRGAQGAEQQGEGPGGGVPPGAPADHPVRLHPHGSLYGHGHESSRWMPPAHPTVGPSPHEMPGRSRRRTSW